VEKPTGYPHSSVMSINGRQALGWGGALVEARRTKGPGYQQTPLRQGRARHSPRVWGTASEYVVLAARADKTYCGERNELPDYPGGLTRLVALRLRGPPRPVDIEQATNVSVSIRFEGQTTAMVRGRLGWKQARCTVGLAPWQCERTDSIDCRGMGVGICSNQRSFRELDWDARRAKR
jgi:hypothetical protein